MAVGPNVRGPGYGETLLMDALPRIRRHSGEVASAGVIMHAMDAAAVTVYIKCGFIESPNVELWLFLPRSRSRRCSDSRFMF